MRNPGAMGQSIQTSERLFLTKQGGEKLKETPDLDLWDAYTRACVPAPAPAHVHTCIHTLHTPLPHTTKTYEDALSE